MADITDYIPELAEERFVKILEAIPDATVIINQEGSIVFINTQTEKLYGFDKNFLLGQNVEVLIPEPYRSRHPQNRINYFHSPKVRPMGTGMKLFGQRQNGEIFPVEISLSPLKINKGIIALATVRDMTDRVRIQQALEEKNLELENASLAKDRFLASMSHELRTPLNAIIGFTGTLLMKLPGPLNPQQEKQLNTVKTSARHLLSLINDLLDLAKIESGKVELKLEKVNCQSVIKEVSTTLSTLAESKGLKFEVIMPEEDITVNTDRRTLMQIIINLANNAIKFTEKGIIKIQLIPSKTNEQDFALIQIQDTGCGIKTEDQVKLFQAFQQMTMPGKRVEGTGLGLHLSQKLATLINSKIEFESEYGKGSRFSITLPKN
jgi:PAS domain S-box-containing protein